MNESAVTFLTKTHTIWEPFNTGRATIVNENVILLHSFVLLIFVHLVQRQLCRTSKRGCTVDSIGT
jgi:hypothetical protein